MISEKDKKLSMDIRKLMTELGVPCIEKDIQESPTYITYHYNLVDKSMFGQVEKKVKFLSAFLHQDITYSQSKVAHFALMIPKDGNDTIEFGSPRFAKLFNIEEPSLNLFVGVDDSNCPVVINLEEMPHILVAGTTGSGKSVLINSIICSILKNSNNISLTLIDTKRVELCQYRDLDFIANVATTFEDAIQELEAECDYIDTIYEQMEKNRWRKLPKDCSRHIVVIEELNDLMMVSKKAVEQYIVKIAQLGRAAGVHLVIATQRPTVSTVTGNIKANIGCRIALQTTSITDSKVILDHGGAEQLKGKGDALLKLPTLQKEIHIQCPLITDEDIENIISETNKRNRKENK